MPTKLKLLPANTSLPAALYGVSSAIKSHPKFSSYHDDAMAIALQLGAGKRNSDPAKLLKSVETHRQKTLDSSIRALKRSGFSVRHGGEKGYKEIMDKIAKDDGKRFRVISACWALEHGLAQASGLNLQGSKLAA